MFGLSSLVIRYSSAISSRAMSLSVGSPSSLALCKYRMNAHSRSAAVRMSATTRPRVPGSMFSSVSTSVRTAISRALVARLLRWCRPFNVSMSLAIFAASSSLALSFIPSRPLHLVAEQLGPNLLQPRIRSVSPNGIGAS